MFLSGHGPFQDGELIRGKLGADLDVDAGYQAARAVMVQLLGSLRAEIGSLDRVSRIVKLHCMVNCTPDFGNHPGVANGASDCWSNSSAAPDDTHVRRWGMQSLPMGMSVEIEMIVEIE